MELRIQESRLRAYSRKALHLANMDGPLPIRYKSHDVGFPSTLSLFTDDIMQGDPNYCYTMVRAEEKLRAKYCVCVLVAIES